MLCSFSNTCFAALICHVLLVQAKHVSLRTDHFCLYKDCSKDTCLKDETSLKVFWQASLDAHSKRNIVKMASGSGESGFFRPRSALARALYEKHRTDLHLEQIDKTEVSHLLFC